jgi:hypothetical protein
MSRWSNSVLDGNVVRLEDPDGIQALFLSVFQENSHGYGVVVVTGREPIQ